MKTILLCILFVSIIICLGLVTDSDEKKERQEDEKQRENFTKEISALYSNYRKIKHNCKNISIKFWENIIYPLNKNRDILLDKIKYDDYGKIIQSDWIKEKDYFMKNIINIPNEIVPNNYITILNLCKLYQQLIITKYNVKKSLNTNHLNKFNNNIKIINDFINRMMINTFGYPNFYLSNIDSKIIPLSSYQINLLLRKDTFNMKIIENLLNYKLDIHNISAFMKKCESYTDNILSILLPNFIDFYLFNYKFYLNKGTSLDLNSVNEKLKELQFDTEIIGISSGNYCYIKAEKNNIKFIIQYIINSSPIGNKMVQELCKKFDFYECDYGIFIANSIYTPTAKILAEKNGIILLKNYELKKLLTLC